MSLRKLYYLRCMRCRVNKTLDPPRTFEGKYEATIIKRHTYPDPSKCKMTGYDGMEDGMVDEDHTDQMVNLRELARP